MWKKHGHEKLISDGYGGFGTKEELEKRKKYLSMLRVKHETTL